MEENHCTKPRAPAATRSTIAYYVAFIALGMAASIIGPTLPKLAEHVNTRLGGIGLLFTASSFGYMLGSMGVGNLIDRWRGHVLLALTILTMAGMLALVPLIGVLWVLAGVVFVLGFAEGGMDVSMNLFLVWFHKEQANPFLNGLHFFFGLGAFLAPIIVGWISLTNGDIHWAYWILAIFPLPTAFWLLRLPSPSSPHTEKKSENCPTNWLLVGLISLIFVFYAGAEAGFGGWIYTYTTSLNLADAAGAALLTSVFWGALTIGRLLGIPIAASLHPTVILAGDLIGSMLSLGLVWIFPLAPAAIWVGTIGLGLFLASVFPTLLAFAERNMTMTGQISRWFFVGTGVGGMVLPWVLGLLIEWVGPRSIIFAIWINVILAMVALLGSLSATRRQLAAV